MSGETLTKNEGQYVFVESAVFADFIKFRGGAWQQQWHFVDQPYFDEGGSEKDYPDFPTEDLDIKQAIRGIVDWFNEEKGYEKS